MVRITDLSISGFRSIKDEINITFPANAPLVLIGENNAGKSNIVLAFDLLFGDSHPKYRELEDHDFWNRSRNDREIRIKASVEPINEVDYKGYTHNYNAFEYRHNRIEPFYEGIETTGRRNQYIKNETRDHFKSIVISGDRRLSYEMSYTSKYTMLSKLMKRFHKELCCDSSRVEQLKGSFKEIVRIFKEVDEFKKFDNTLRNDFTKMIEGMSYGLSVDFSAYDPSNFYHSLRVFPEQEGESRNFDELGTGEQQLLIMAFAHAYAKSFFGGIILVLEEPEAHLHPLAQKWLAMKLREMCDDGLQIIITTHNPYFIDLMGLDGLVLVKKENNETKIQQRTKENFHQYCLQHGANQNKCWVNNILPFYQAAAIPEILEGFFARKVVLVEGQTESLALPVYFSRLNLDANKEGIAFIPVFGKGNLAKWWRLFTSYGIPTYVIFDNDISSEDKDATKRKDVLKCFSLDEKQVSGLVQSGEWLVEDRFCVFGEDYEKILRKYFPDYIEIEKKAKEILGDAKPLVARYVAGKIELQDKSDGTQYMIKLRDAIVNLS